MDNITYTEVKRLQNSKLVKDFYIENQRIQRFNQLFTSWQDQARFFGGFIGLSKYILTYIEQAKDKGILNEYYEEVL